MAAMISDELELKLLRLIEEKLDAMFKFTGWDKDQDVDAARAVNEVRWAHDDLKNYRELLEKTKHI